MGHMFILSINDDGGTNILIDDYLYFLLEKDILPKCNKAGNESHKLTANNNSSTNTESRLCSRKINNNSHNSNSGNDASFECGLCQESSYKDCCHSLVVNEIPQEMKQSKYFDMKILNISNK